jgi:transcriptional regulator with XRE-family HTH domain
MPSAIARKFGTHVRALRTMRKLTQEALAESSGLSVDSIRRIERGTFSPTLDTLDKLARGLSLTLATLFGSLDDVAPNSAVGRRADGGRARSDHATERSTAIVELSEYLANKPDREVRTAFRVLRAMFEGTTPLPKLEPRLKR